MAFFVSFLFSTPVYAAGSFSLTDAEITDKSEYVIADVQSIDDASITIHTVFHRENDYVIYRLSFTNGSEYTRKITDITDNNLADEILLEYNKHIDEEIEPGETLILDIKLIYGILIDNGNPVDIDTTLSLFITSVEIIPQTTTPTETDPTTDTITIDPSEDVPAVPNTGALFGGIDFSSDVFTVATLLIILTLGFTVAVVLIIKNRPRTASKIVIVALSAFLMTPLVAKADDNSINININNSIALRNYLNVRWVEQLEGEDAPEYDEEYTELFEDIVEYDYLTVEGYTGDWDYFDYYDGYELSRATYGENGPDLNKDDLILDNTTLYFYFTPIEYYITYDLDGGTLAEANPTKYTIKDEFTLNNPTKEGYTFLGWAYRDYDPNTELTISGEFGDIDFVAVWEDSNQSGGSEDPDPGVTVPFTSTILQNMTTEECNRTSIGQSASMIDIRDNTSHTVRKLEDGQCWMTTPLSLTDVTITPEDSDLPSGSFTIPASNQNNFSTSDEDNKNATIYNEDYGVAAYTVYTATAGWATYGHEDGNTPRSICPKGWRLPQAGAWNDGEINRVKKLYAHRVEQELGFPYAGYYDPIRRAFREAEDIVIFWTGSFIDGELWRIMGEKNYFSQDIAEYYYGFYAICVAR